MSALLFLQVSGNERVWEDMYSHSNKPFHRCSHYGNMLLPLFTDSPVKETPIWFACVYSGIQVECVSVFVRMSLCRPHSDDGMFPQMKIFHCDCVFEALFWVTRYAVG
jgi:hypothetical protein